MLTLSEAILEIKANYPYEEILLPDFSYEINSIQTRSYPRYLFRGERTTIWRNTLSTASRKQLVNDPNFTEINHWLSGRQIPTSLIVNRFSLYFFLKEAVWNMSPQDGEHEIKVDINIAAFMQHYGFDTSFIDLTSDIHVAAHFASHNSKEGEIGQIFILRTDSLENLIFDLTQVQATRPKRQKSYVILAPDQFDLRSPEFIERSKMEIIQFRLTKEDQDTFIESQLLSINDDRIAEAIMDWYYSHIDGNINVSMEVKSFFASKIKDLQRNCTTKP